MAAQKEDGDLRKTKRISPGGEDAIGERTVVPGEERHKEMRRGWSAFPKVCPEISVSEILHKERSPWSIIRVTFSLLETCTPKFYVS